MTDEIKHTPIKVNEVIRKINEAKIIGNKLEDTLGNLSDNIQDNFSGLAKDSLVALLDQEVKKIEQEKENWQSLFNEAKNIATNIEEQDRLLIK